jgi:hypothetical protein
MIYSPEIERLASKWKNVAHVFLIFPFQVYLRTELGSGISCLRSLTS